jgi:hypothetical protein
MVLPFYKRSKAVRGGDISGGRPPVSSGAFSKSGRTPRGKRKGGGEREERKGKEKGKERKRKKERRKERKERKGRKRKEK